MSSLSPKVDSEKYQTYLFEYFHEGSNWMVEISATSLDDAQARIKKLPWAKPLGELVVKIPAVTGLGVFMRMLCWLKNSLSAR